MKTAIDTNIISALWAGQPSAPAAEAALTHASEAGNLVICGVVFAELIAHPNISHASIGRFLDEAAIDVDSEMDRAIWEEAGIRYAAYCRRRRSVGEKRERRLLADFIIGAHAQAKADRLLTFDRSRYSRDFPKLKLMTA